MNDASFAAIPGGGSVGMAWAEIAASLDAVILRAPDEASIHAMGDGLVRSIEMLPRPRVLVGASMGALVALEIARQIDVDALVLIACGFGIEVGDSVIKWMERNPSDIHQKLAKICLADRQDAAKLATLVADYDACGHERHLRQVKAMAAHTPRALPTPPPTIVIWGMQDSAIPLEDHIELALQCKGAVVPIAGAAHVPFLEQPEATSHWIQAAAVLAATRSAPTT